MLKDKKALEKYLDQQCDRIVVDNNKCKAIYTYANETYDIPKGLVSDLITRRKTMTEATEFVLFILLDSMHSVLKDEKIQGIDKFYTMQETQYYRKSKYETGSIKFPLVFKMIQVEDDQWIGKIDVKTLMQLRQAQLVHYNTNAQRTMQRIVKGDKEIYKIDVNDRSVDEIATEFRNGTFIPNTITLNIPMETESDFYYDEDSCSLVIKSIKHFDNTDGFHRYLGAGRASDLDDQFNYSMELRIINFTEDKAKHFIHQEDKKNKMKKVDAKSMNMNSAANNVVTRLNENVRCNLKDLIDRNKGTVNFGELAELVEYFYFKGVGKEKENTIKVEAVKELTNNFNMLTEYNMNYLERRMSYKTLLAAMFCFDYYKNNGLNTDNMCEIIEKTAKKLEASESTKFKNKTPRKSLMAEVEKAMKGVMNK